MNLFIDTISPVAVLILFDDNRNIKNKYDFDIKMRESDFLSFEVDEFLSSNSIKYQDLENIVVVSWPGSFTWVRSSCLVVNTINFVIQKNITSISYFDLFFNYPIIKTSSKRDVFYKSWQKEDIKIIQNEDLKEILKNIEVINWDINFDFLENTTIISKPDYENIIKNIIFKSDKIISPIYIKKPNIS